MVDVPASLAATARACESLHQGEWSLASIAGELDVDEAWGPLPPRLLACLTIADQGAISALSDRAYHPTTRNMLRARVLAEVIAARALGYPIPHVAVVSVQLWRQRITRRQFWAGATLLTVSADDVTQIAEGLATTAEIAGRRGVPEMIVRARMAQEVAYGWRDGDELAALCQLVNLGPPFLGMFDRVTGACIRRGISA